MDKSNFVSDDEKFYDPSSVDAGNVHQLTCIVIGGGQRGSEYALYAKDFPHLVKVVAIADPKLHLRQKFKKLYNLDEDKLFTDWKDIAGMGKIADFAIICTPDKLHKEPAIAMANQGYHILLEKPMATTVEDCEAIVKACKDNEIMLSVGHVLRYYPPTLKIKEIIESGSIGEIVSIQHLEPVGYFHFAHSYVRGNWRNEKESSFSLLTKSCHDIDLICYWMPTLCKSVSSFGSLSYFKKDNKPVGAGERCLDCKVEKECPYSAVKIYLNPAKAGYFGWPINIVVDIEDLHTLTTNLKSGQYGKCVFQSDNDVCDNQVVNLAFEGGKTASFTMIAFTEQICKRNTKVFGTKGELTYEGDTVVKHYDFLSRKTQIYNCKSNSTVHSSLRGHDGADFYLMDLFVKAVMFNEPSYIASNPDDSLLSHKIVFASERSRVLGKTLHLQEDDSWE